MTIFKYFFKILKEYKVMIIIYTIILIFFGAFTMQNSESSTSFVADKPDVLIINKGETSPLVENFENYIKENATIKEIENAEEAISDALFYRDIHYIIYIPEHYQEDFMSGKEPKIEVKQTGDYEGSYMQLLVERYLKVAKLYQGSIKEEKALVASINETLKEEIEIDMTSKIDKSVFTKATSFYNFSSYSILAGCVFIIATVMSSFREKNIKKRIDISATNYKKYNRILFLGNAVFAILLWAIYVIISVVLAKEAMFTLNGLAYMVNSLLFSICALSLAFLIATIISDKNAISGMVNVIALGSSFLCGAFVPARWLPEAVIKVAHFLPSYWFIQNNELIGKIEEFSMEKLQPIIINGAVIIGFAILFSILMNVIARKKRRA